MFVAIQKVRIVLQVYLSLECVEFGDHIVNCLLPTEALATAISWNRTCFIRPSGNQGRKTILIKWSTR
jgi:hypothetical protein